MTTKSLAGMLVLLTAAFTTVHATELSPSTGIFFTGTAGLKYDSNIFLANTNTKSSGVFEIIPGVELNMGSGSMTKNVFVLSEDFVSYLSASDQNTNLTNAQYDLGYSDDKLRFALDAGFHQLSQNNRDTHLVGHILQTDITNITPELEFEISPKSAIAVGVDYENYRYDLTGYANRSSVALPLDAYFEVVPKVQASVGYRYRSNSVGAPGLDSNDNYFSVGARGDFDPLLKGSFSVGYNQRKIKAGTVNSVYQASRTESGIGATAKLEYLYSDKTTVQFTVRNDFSNAATGESQKVFEGGVGLASAMSSVLTADASVFIGNYKYVSTTRRDDYYRLQTGVTYSYNTHVKCSATYSYQDNSSNISNLSFTENLFGVSLAVRL